MKFMINDILEAYDDDGNRMRIRIVNISNDIVYAQSIEMLYADGRKEIRRGKSGEWDLTKRKWEKVIN